MKAPDVHQNIPGNILKATCTDNQADLDKLVEGISSDRSAFFDYLDSFLEYDPQFSDEVENIHTVMDDAASIRERIVEASAKFSYEAIRKRILYI